jgi:hypothetical protein
VREKKCKENGGGISQTKERIQNTPEKKKAESIEKEGVRLTETAERPIPSVKNKAYQAEKL